MSLANCLLSNLVCSLSESLLKFSLTAASGFSDTTRILLHGGTTMTKINLNLPPQLGNSNPHCFCYCRQPVDNTLAYIVVVATFFHPPNTPGGLALQPELLGVNNSLYLDPTQLDKQSKKSNLNANWMYTLFIYFMCSYAFVLLVLSTTVTLCIAFLSEMIFP